MQPLLPSSAIICGAHNMLAKTATSPIILDSLPSLQQDSNVSWRARGRWPLMLTHSRPTIYRMEVYTCTQAKLVELVGRSNLTQAVTRRLSDA
jgi:hypothetical protein